MSAEIPSAATSREEQATPDVVAPPPGHRRFPLLDSLRAIAALSVLVFHAGQFGGLTLLHGESSGLAAAVVSHLNIGLAIFFVLSGFLLYRPFVAARVDGPRAPRPTEFAWRRALRILPAYWVALTALSIYPGLKDVFTSHWWAYYGMLQIYPVYQPMAGCDPTLGCGIAPAWSLDVEVAMYFLIPLVALAAGVLASRGARHRPRREVLVPAVLALIGVGLFAWSAAAPFDRSVPFLLSSGLIWFAMGMTLAAVSATVRATRSGLTAAIGRWPLAPWVAAAGLYVTYALIAPSTPVFGSVSAWVTDRTVFGGVAVLLLLPAVFGDRAGGLPRRVLANPLLSWLGLISYGIYLWHVPLMGKLDEIGASDWIPGSATFSLAVVTLAAAAGCAAASYYIVERPILRLKYRPLRRRRKPAPPAPKGAH